MIALESAEWFDLQQNFLFWTRPKHSLLESEWGVKQRDLHDNGRNIIKGGSRETKGQKRMGGGRTGYGRREIVTPLPLPPPPPPHRPTVYSDTDLTFHIFLHRIITCLQSALSNYKRKLSCISCVHIQKKQ